MHAPRPTALVAAAVAAGLLVTAAPAPASAQDVKGDASSSAAADDTKGGKRASQPPPSESYRSTRIPKGLTQEQSDKAREDLKGVLSRTMDLPDDSLDAEDGKAGPSRRRTLERGMQAVDDLTQEDLELVAEAFEQVPDLSLVAATPTVSTSPSPAAPSKGSSSSLRGSRTSRLTASSTVPTGSCPAPAVTLVEITGLRAAAFALDKVLLFVPSDMTVAGFTTTAHPAKLVAAALYTAVESVLFAREAQQAFDDEANEDCDDSTQVVQLQFVLDQLSTTLSTTISTATTTITTNDDTNTTTITTNDDDNTTAITLAVTEATGLINQNVDDAESAVLAKVASTGDAINSNIDEAVDEVNTNTDAEAEALRALVQAETDEIDAEQEAHDAREARRFAALTTLVTDRFTRVDVNLAALQATVDESVSRDLEEYLAGCTALVTLYLPKAEGGRLETVRALVGRSVTAAERVGVNVGVARNKLATGDAAYAAASYPRAYGDFCAAYRSLTTPAN